jgi:hypothetical protein
MSATDPVTPAVHDSAAVVFSRSLSFVEWKFVVASSDPFATGERGGKPPYRDIPTTGSDKGERWIYAFSRTRDTEPFDLKEEIYRAPNGEMAATRFEDLEDLSKEVGARARPEPVGKTLVLPRRRFGWVLEYRFYASRVRLPLVLIRQLEGRGKDGNPRPDSQLARRIDRFAPRTYLDPGDNKSVFERDGKLLVPVVDPVAIMLNWHASYEEAATDVINYTTPHGGLEAQQKERVALRRKKHLLADLLNRLLDEEASNVRSDLASQLAAGGKGAIASYVTDYEAQVKWRVGLRDQLADLLTRWLESGAIATAAAAHDGGPKVLQGQFRTLFCHAHTGLATSPGGRAYLSRLALDDKHLGHALLWSIESRTDDQVQWARKSAVTVLEAYKAIVEALHDPKIVKEVWRGMPKQVEERLNALMGFEKGTLKVEPAAKVVDVHGKKVPYPTFDLDVSYEKKLEFKKTAGVIAAIEGINFVYAVVAAREQLASADPKQRQQALIGVLGSALDAGTSLLKMLEKGENVARVMSFVSGVIDVYMAVGQQNERYTLGDLGGAKGSFLVAAGSTIGTAAVMLEVMGFATAAAGAVTAIGLAVVAVGYLYKLIKGRAPLQIFVAHTEWGKDRDDHKLDTPDWSPAEFKQWHGTSKGYDYQLQALLNLICKFEIGHAKTSYRELELKLGWVPPGATLHVGYQESWEKTGPTKTLTGIVTFGDPGPTATGPFRPSMKDNALTLVVTSHDLPPGPVLEKMPTPVGTLYKPVAHLKWAEFAAKLRVSFPHVAVLMIPAKGRKAEFARFPS